MDRVNGANWIDIGGGNRGFRALNALAGTPGTEVTDTWLNDLQENFLTLPEQLGIPLVAGNHATHRVGIHRAVSASVFCIDTGAANAYVLTPPSYVQGGGAWVAPTSYFEGMEVEFQASAMNTGAATVNYGGIGAVPLKRPNGAACTGGEVFGRTVARYHEAANEFRLQPWSEGILGGSFLRVISASVTYEVGTLTGADFPDLAAAHASLKGAVLLPGVIVTFAMQSQTHVLNASVIFDHPQMRQVRIIAKDGLTQLGGPHSNGMTLTSTSAQLYTAANRTNDNNLNEAYLKARFNAIIQFGSGGPSLVFKTGCASIQNILVDGNGSASGGFVVSDSVIDLNTVAGIDCSAGVVGTFARINTNGLFMSGCGTGLDLSGSHLSASGGEFIVQGSTVGYGLSANHGSRLISSISGNFKLRTGANHGLGMGWNSSVHARGAQFIGNTKSGAWVIGNSSAYLDLAQSYHNGESGVHCAHGSYVDAGGGNMTSNNYSAGGFTGLFAGTGSSIFAVGYTTGTTFSPALNTVGNDNSYIKG